ncbi:MAG TPA: NADH-quinone oxidoreductase subunit N [Acidimicrobiales bacterium]|nr:NADH-quinone oxidoreductase subunit N [Acidimicrobiales bacterium]
MSVLVAAASSTHLTLPKIAWLSILPVIAMLAGAVVLLSGSAVARRQIETVWVTTITVATASVALVLSLFQWFDVQDHGPHVAIDGSIVQDGFSALVSILVSCAVFISAFVGDGWLRRDRIVGPEFQVLMMVSASGAMIMGMANDLIVVFLGLEIMSIALYVLAAFNSRRSESGEAALKYFVLGSFSSAVFLYGIALVYGSVGSTNLVQISDYFSHNIVLHNGLLLAGLALLLVGFGFKIAAVPFHLWTPDVYQGSPTPVTGFMAAVAKAGGFAALLRVFITSFGLLRTDWQPAVWVLAALTLLLGSIVALVQRDIKRMLAYSSINHAGFILLGLQAADSKGVEASLYYLFVYTFMVIGTFAIVTIVGGTGDGAHDLGRYRNLSARQPWLAASLAILLVAQAGIPFTTGFLAKLEVLDAAVGAHSTVLAVIAMVTAVIAAFFYLRVIVLMYAPAVGAGAVQAGAAEAGAGTGASEDADPPIVDVSLAEITDVDAPRANGGDGAARRSTSGVAVLAPAEEAEKAEEADEAEVLHAEDEADMPIPASTSFAIVLCVAVTVFFGIYPSPLTDLAHQATLLIRP